MPAPAFRQHGHDVRLEWGADGIAALAADCAVLVIVDVLSFCTTTELAIARGARVLPLPWHDDRAATSARAAGAVLAGDREWTLRPASVSGIPAGTLFALPSPNGATLCGLARARRGAGARRVPAQRDGGGTPGSRAGGRPTRRRDPRRGTLAGPGRDDLAAAVRGGRTGAGAIVAALGEANARGTCPSPEAELAAAGYRATGARMLPGCASGRELIAAGHAGDVRLAGAVDVSEMVPVLREDVLTR